MTNTLEDISYEENSGIRSKPIESEGRRDRSFLSKLKIIFATLICSHFVLPTFLNYLVADYEMKKLGRTKAQIEESFDPATYPPSLLNSFCNLVFNSKPQRYGRDIAYYLNKK